MQLAGGSDDSRLHRRGSGRASVDRVHPRVQPAGAPEEQGRQGLAPDRRRAQQAPRPGPRADRGRERLRRARVEHFRVDRHSPQQGGERRGAGRESASGERAHWSVGGRDRGRRILPRPQGEPGLPQASEAAVRDRDQDRRLA